MQAIRGRRFPRGIGMLPLIGYLAVLAFLCAAGGAAMAGIRTMRDHYTLTVEVTDALNAAVLAQLRLLDDQETGFRGYLLTGQASNPQPYRAAAEILRLAGARSCPGPG
ncbi:MAG TPA: CHASE3 domain-containing protein [Chloroflexota bacterium]|nr:CHASE3 domain-containing protein [Chloroflexota bacterium]